ncbi:MAG: hypothetical protein IPJ82_06180 [Lewinellaceae bacterium]|nr:hypothetical protein [Lewinellaceae bacterium]
MASTIQFNGFSAEFNPAVANKTKVQIRKPDSGQSLAELVAEECRDWLIGDNNANITLNAVIRMAHFVAKNLGLDYQTPTDLRGTAEDFHKILPDHIIAGIGMLQANANTSIAGKPGKGFIKGIMGVPEDSSDFHLKFMEESANTDLMDEIGTLVMPKLGQPESEFYQYFRRLTRLRNGLWSDEPGITNISGIRRTKNSKITWNDVLVVSWKDADGALHCKAYTATTEPGNKAGDPTVPPQTYIVRAGYHHGQQPGGRCFRVMARDEDNLNLKYTREDGRGINFHSGGSSCAPQNLVKHALPGGTAAAQKDFAKNIALVEIYKILTRWGLDKTISSWQILNKTNEALKDWTEARLAGVVKADDREIRVRQVTGGVSNEKVIQVAEAIKWTVNKWINIEKDPDALLRILKNADPGFAAPADWNTLNSGAVTNLVKPAHIRAIVEKQCKHFTTLNEIDGKPGKSYLIILAGRHPEVLKNKENAQKDLARLQELFKTEGITPAETEYVKKICFNSMEERRILALGNVESRQDDKAFDIEEDVKTWSTACQVVFGPEQFYEFWYYVVGKALQTGQRQWYYTIFDFNTLEVQKV